jgi:aldose 1-epimerase
MRDQTYTARLADDNGVPTVHLADAAHGVEVSTIPSFANRAYEMRVKGENILHFPFDSPAAATSARQLNGIPFLAPWANRMTDGFHANGKHYGFNKDLEWVRLDANGISIHGVLWKSPFWEVTDVDADENSAHVTSRLEFWKHPDLMANWPFAHNYEMTYRLAGGVLEISVTVTNLSTDPMPIAVGFHPYFTLPGVPIEEAVAQMPVRRHVETDSRLVATGETAPVGFTNPVSLKDNHFDDGFTDLIKGSDGRTVFSVEGRGRKIEVVFGPRYQVAVVFSPPGQNYVCFEPMSAVTNGINLAYEGKYPELQTVPADGRWQESFWVRPSGF